MLGLHLVKSEQVPALSKQHDFATVSCLYVITQQMQVPLPMSQTTHELPCFNVLHCICQYVETRGRTCFYITLQICPLTTHHVSINVESHF